MNFFDLRKEAFKTAKKGMIDMYEEKLKPFENELKESNGIVTVNINDNLKGSLIFENVNEDLKNRIIDFLK